MHDLLTNQDAVILHGNDNSHNLCNYVQLPNTRCEKIILLSVK